MARRMFNRRAPRGAPRPRHWTAATASGGIGVGAISEEVLLSRNDYNSTGGADVSPSGVTMARCVGEFVIVPGASAGIYVVNFGICHIEDDETVVAGGAYDPSNNTQLITERWLWLGTCRWRCDTAVGYPEPQRWPFDIKQKVRLRDSGLSLVIINSAGSAATITMAYVSRTLLIGDTN